MHDSFLNDIYDSVAHELARRITAYKGFYLFQNYD
jgi:hypothetical protein